MGEGFERNRAQVLHFAKLQKQDELRLKRDFIEYDRLRKLKLSGIDKEQEQITAEITNTHRTRIDASDVYIGVLPDIKRAPRIKPLPSDKEYITRIVKEKQRKWKKKEALSMRELISNIENRLNSFVKVDGKTATVTKPHFLVPLDKDIEKIDFESRKAKQKRKRVMSLPEIMNLVDSNRINVRRAKVNQKHLVDGKANNGGQELAAVDESDLNRGDNYKQQTSKLRRASILDPRRLSMMPQNGLPTLKEHSRNSSLRLIEEDIFYDNYNDCSKSRYLRNGSPLDRIPDDILDVFR